MAWMVAMILGIGYQVAEAQRAAPAGDRWWCTSMSLHNLDEGSLCARTEAGCDHHRESWLADQNEFSRPFASECAPQVKATIVYYYSVMHDRDMYWVHSAMAHCRAMRTQLVAAKGDISRVSACTIVGATKPPMPNKRLVPKGKAWACFEEEKRTRDEDAENIRFGACFRKQTECEAAHENARSELEDETLKTHRTCETRQPKAFVMTVGKDAAVFPTMEICRMFREFAANAGPSACAPFP